MRRFRIALKLTILVVLISNLSLFAGTGLITNVAGTGVTGNAGIGGPATSAQLNVPVGLCYDPAGNLYIADYVNNRVVRVEAATGNLTLVAGNGGYTSTGDGGPASLASLHGPAGLALDAAGNLYISELSGYRVRRVDAQTGIITTFAGNGSTVSSGDFGPATMAGLQAPFQLAADASGNLYIGENANNLRRVDAATGIITTALAKGTGGFSGQGWLAFDHSGNLLITDSGLHKVLRFNPATSALDTFAGDGSLAYNGDGMAATSSSLGSSPGGITVDAAGNVYVACWDTFRIRRIDAVTGVISTIAGNGIYNANTPGPIGGPANQAQIKPMAIAASPGGSLSFTPYFDAASAFVYGISLPSPWTSTATSLVLAPLTVSPNQPVTFTATTTSIDGSGTPTGTVTFQDSLRQTIGTAALVSGIATFTTPAPAAAGTYGVFASYGGDSAFAASISPPSSLTVQSGTGGTSLSLASTPNPSAPGDVVNVVAYLYLNGSSLTPTGTIQLLDAGTVVATATVTSTRIPMTVIFSAGTHPLTAVYSGDSNFLGVTSQVFNQVVKLNPTVTIASQTNPATIGGLMTLTATVSPSAATGVVEFIEYVPPAAMTWGIQPLVNGTATLTITLPPSMTAGTHYIQAYYHGDANYNSANSATVAQQIVKPPVAVVSLSSTMNPASVGTQFSINVTVTPPAGSTGQPTGSVQLVDGSAVIGTVNLTNGVAQFPVTLTTPGAHVLTAVYSGDAGFGGSTSAPLSEAIKNTIAFYLLGMTPSPSVVGTSVTFSASLTQTTATGTVEFVDTLPTPAVSLGIVAVTGGSVSLTTSSLAAGTHTINIVYSGDANFMGTSASVSQVVKVASTAVLSASPASAVYGQAVQITATLTPSAATGSVQYFDGPTILGTVPVSNGTAVLNLPALAAGTHSIGAAYFGDATYAGANASNVTVTVAKATPSVTVSSSQNPAPSGQGVTFTVVVTPANATGSVQLMDGSTVVANLGAGTTTANVTLGVGQHSVTAVYSGDANFSGITSAAVSQLMTSTTATTVSTDLPNSTFGQSVRLTATVAPAPAGGTIQFLDGVTALGTVPVQGGAASLAVSTLAVGTHAITAVYSGDGAAYLGSTSAVFTQTVSKAGTAATLAASPNPATAGQSVTMTAAVSPVTATGTVQFFDGAVSLGTVPVSGGAASLSTSALGAGSHSLTVVYLGDATYSTSTSNVVSETVNKAATTATLGASPNPATVGQSVTLSAVVSPSTATGTVQFFDGAISVGTVPVSNGAASLATSALGAGSHSLSVVYSGDATYSTSTSNSVSETVNKAATTATLGASPNPATVGQSVTLSAAISPSTATGTVQFFDGATALGTVPVSGGAATLGTSALGAGGHSLSAVYSGDATYSTSTSNSVSETVNKAATSATLAASPNPSTVGQSITLSAAVSPSTATGTVQFFDGATSLGMVPVSNGAAIFATSALGAGGHSLSAVYSGDATYSTSTSNVVTETVNKAATTATLGASPNPATVGQSVTLSVSVSPATATGTVQFFDGATSLGTVPVSSGAATLATSAFGAGSHSLSAVYSGDATYLPKTSNVVTETINKAATTTTLTSSLNPSVSGQSVTFTSQVAPSAATGTIQFKNGSTLLGTGTLSGGAASLAISSLSVGTHSITAIYSGDANYTTSTSAALTQTVTTAIPGAASNLTATAASSSQINLAWTASPTSGVTYNVYSSTTSGFTPAAGNRIATGITATTYSHTGLAPSSIHYYKVTAQNSAGESASSNQASATTQAAGVSCQVVYTVTTQWNIGFGTALTIKNTGSTPINGWNLTWAWAGNQQITQSWNANYTQTGKNASLTNMSYNPTIAPGATLSGVGFNGSYSGTNTAPSAFYVNGTLCQ